MRILKPKPLTAKAFQLYGDVIDTQTTSNTIEINYGQTTRFHDMATLDLTANQGKPGFSIFEAKPVDFPHDVNVMEYHPQSSQLFYPLCETPFFVLVAPKGEALSVEDLALFISNGKQGVNYHKGTWHHYLLAISDKPSQFIVVDRIANDDNCIESKVDEQIVINWGSRIGS